MQNLFRCNHALIKTKRGLNKLTPAEAAEKFSLQVLETAILIKKGGNYEFSGGKRSSYQ